MLCLLILLVFQARDVETAESLDDTLIPDEISTRERRISSDFSAISLVVLLICTRVNAARSTKPLGSFIHKVVKRRNKKSDTTVWGEWKRFDIYRAVTFWMKKVPLDTSLHVLMLISL